MKQSLNPSTLPQFLIGAGSTKPAEAMFLHQHKLGIAQLQTVRARILEEAAALADATAFNESYGFLERRSPAVQQRVLSHPAVSMWSRTALALLSRGAHLRFPQLHCHSHLESFGRFAVAAAMLDPWSSLEASLRLGENGGLVLSGSARCIYAGARHASHKVKVTITSGVATTNRFKIESLPICSNGLELDGIDGTLRITGRPPFTFEDVGRLEASKWISALDAALDMVAGAWPDVFRELRLGMRCVVPVASANPNVHASATFRETPGLTALSWTSDVDVLAEALVHEHHHSRLNALLNLDGCVQTLDAKRFLSPWRNDPRPILGILHGAYAFHAVVEFWIRVFETKCRTLHERRARQRVNLVFLQVREALRTLGGSADLTPIGDALVRSMNDRMESLQERLPKISSASMKSIAARISTHREAWEQRNSTAAPTTVVSTSSPSDAEIATLNRLGIDWRVARRSLSATGMNEDALAESVTRFVRAGGDPIAEVAPDDLSSSALLNLIAGHGFYASRAFNDAMAAFRRYGDLSPEGHRHAQLCIAFCLRHLHNWESAESILDRLMIE